jgi:hypothetical protein
MTQRRPRRRAICQRGHAAVQSAGLRHIDVIRSGGFSWYNGFELHRAALQSGFGYNMFYDMANALEAVGALPAPNQFCRSGAQRSR